MYFGTHDVEVVFQAHGPAHLRSLSCLSHRLRFSQDAQRERTCYSQHRTCAAVRELSRTDAASCAGSREQDHDDCPDRCCT